MSEHYSSSVADIGEKIKLGSCQSQEKATKPVNRANMNIFLEEVYSCAGGHSRSALSHYIPIGAQKTYHIAAGVFGVSANDFDVIYCRLDAPGSN